MSTTNDQLGNTMAVAWILFRDDLGMWKWAKADATGRGGESREAFTTVELCLLELKRGIRAHETDESPEASHLPLSAPAVVAMFEILRSAADSAGT
jgi:hypothetical protein